MDTAKLNSALEAALVFLGNTPEGARFRLKDILVEEVSFVDRAANRRRFLIVKQRGDGMKRKTAKGDAAADVELAEWTTAYINDLPDSAFLYIEPGGEKDEDGKTVPRSLRHFPVRDAEGNLDVPHLRNAISRIPQSTAPGLTPEKMEELQNQARRLLEEAGGEEMTEGAEAGKSSDSPEPDVRLEGLSLVLPAPVREDLLLATTDALEKLVAVSTAVKAAEAAAEDAPVEIPSELLSELAGIDALVRGPLSRYPSPMVKAEGMSPKDQAREILWSVMDEIDRGALDDPETKSVAETLLEMIKEHVMKNQVAKGDEAVSRELMEVSTAAVSLAETAAKADEVDPDFLAELRKLAARMNKLAESIPQPEAKEAPEGEGEAEATSEGKATDENAAEGSAEDAAAEGSAAEGSAEASAEAKEEGEGAEGAASEDEGEGEGERREVTLEEMDEKLSPVGTEAADKLKVLGEAMIRIANIGDPAELVLLRDELAKAEAELAAKVEKGGDGAEKLGKILEHLRRAIALIDETGDSQAAPAPAEGDAASADKRAAEAEALPPPNEDGGPGTVGSGPDDKPAREGTDDLAGIMKAVGALAEKVEKLSGVPQVPASRTETTTGSRSTPSRSNGTDRGGRGGPWVL